MYEILKYSSQMATLEFFSLLKSSHIVVLIVQLKLKYCFFELLSKTSVLTVRVDRDSNVEDCFLIIRGKEKDDVVTGFYLEIHRRLCMYCHMCVCGFYPEYLWKA